MASTSEQRKKLVTDRARVYSFLSRIYREEVDKKFLCRMKEGFNSVDCKDAELSRAYNNLRIFLNRIEIDDQLVTDLASDYADLFLGIGKHPAHPYESVYRGGNGTIMGKPRDEVVGFYGKERLRRVEWFKEPEDHIAHSRVLPGKTGHRSSLSRQGKRPVHKEHNTAHLAAPVHVGVKEPCSQPKPGEREKAFHRY